MKSDDSDQADKGKYLLEAFFCKSAPKPKHCHNRLVSLAPEVAIVTYLSGYRGAARFFSAHFGQIITKKPIETIISKIKSGKILITKEDCIAVADFHPDALRVVNSIEFLRFININGMQNISDIRSVKPEGTEDIIENTDETVIPMRITQENQISNDQVIDERDPRSTKDVNCNENTSSEPIVFVSIPGKGSFVGQEWLDFARKNNLPLTPDGDYDAIEHEQMLGMETIRNLTYEEYCISCSYHKSNRIPAARGDSVILANIIKASGTALMNAKSLSLRNKYNTIKPLS